MMSFSFSFSGDDIDEPDHHASNGHLTEQPINSSSSSSAAAPSAFPIPGKPLLPPQLHPLSSLLATLPSQIAYDTLPVTLDDGSTVHLPRRELWDVRVQIMAEEDEAADADARAAEGAARDDETGLGQHDVKTGVYEGGFKSWESSVDLVKVLAAENVMQQQGDMYAVELGCGTALPTLALFHLTLTSRPSTHVPSKTTLVVTDYNPTVLRLVTLPNLLLTWALHQAAQQSPVVQSCLDAADGHLDITPELLQAFGSDLQAMRIELHFLSGGWSEDLVHLLTPLLGTAHQHEFPNGDAPVHGSHLVLMGAETIYSPFALQAFTETVLSILKAHPPQLPKGTTSQRSSQVYVAAKKHYFGVGGSLGDFVTSIQEKGCHVTELREEAQGVRRGVVKCVLNTST